MEIYHGRRVAYRRLAVADLCTQRQMNVKNHRLVRSKADGVMTEGYHGISAELPGVAVGDLQIIAQDGTLTVQGETRFDHTESGRTYFFSERECRALQRSFRLPPDAAGSPY